LTANKKYYIEALHKDGTGGDNLAVGWQGPGITGEAERPIPASRLYKWLPPPAITTQPSNQSVAVGASATFNVVATGTALRYQWRKGGTNISGANSASYITPATVIGDNGALFSCVVTNGAETATSNNATLTVTGGAPTITTQPSNQTVTAGQTATFSVVASGSGTLSYQWRKNGSNISGATSASYTTPATVAGDNGALFSCVVTNASGSVTSNNALLTVNYAPTITTQPSNQAVNEGQTATFSIAATGNPAPTYQWRKNGTNISGATSTSYTTPVTVAGDNGALFSCVVTNTVGSVTSNNATLTVYLLSPVITTQPLNKTVTEGQTATFTVVATGTSLSYQWRKNGTNIGGATSASYTTPATTTADNGALYSCVVSNTGGSATSNNATLTVNCVLPVITQQPAAMVVTEGQTATFTIAANGTGITYQWRKNGTSIVGATSSSYTTPITVVPDNGAQYSCIITNSCGSLRTPDLKDFVKALF
jgi:hypothetical protein